jgi:HEPN domain-containing protein
VCVRDHEAGDQVGAGWEIIADVERSGDWMHQALRDLEHARHVAAAGFHEWACFSAQQSAEKAAKAALQHHGAVAWGHSVADLLNALSAVSPVPTDLVDAGLELDKAYIPARYPDAHPSGAPRDLYTRTEADRLVNHAERIVGFCQGLLSS